MKWIRVASRVVADAKVRQLARETGCDPYKIVGHLVTLWGVMTEQAKDGNLEGVHADDIEAWAEWSGRGCKPGQFAAAVRALLCTPGGVMDAWEEYQGAAIREHEADRKRKRRGNSAGTPPENPRPSGGIPPLRDETRRDSTAAACLPAFAGATELATSAIRPAGEQTVAAITGVIVGDIAGAALLWTVALNRGVTEAHGERPVPIRHDRQLEAAEGLLEAGVDVAWGANWCYHRARRSTGRNIPGSLAYVAAGLKEAWANHLADQQAAATPFTAGPDPHPAPPLLAGGQPTPVRRFPSAADRLSEQSTQNTRMALAALKGRSA